MKIDIKNEQDITHIDLTGRIDTNSSPELQSKLEEYYNKAGFQLILNFEGIDYVSSAGLRVLLLIQKKANAVKGTMVLKNVSPEIKEVFEMTGFLDILTLE